MEEKPVIEHYADFRKVVIYSLSFFLICFITSLFAVQWSIPFLTQGHQLVMLGPMEVIQLYFTVAATIALGLSIPFTLLQIWSFLRAALTDKESKIALSYIPSIFIFFCLGLAFGYFIVFPLVYYFLVELGQIHFDMMVTAKEYFSFLMLTTFPFGFLFELPIVIMFLTSLGVLTPQKLSKMRKYAYFVLVIISVLVTPPDFISDVLVIFPMILLYELGIILSRRVYKKKQSAKLS